jgi:hypothetical protein
MTDAQERGNRLLSFAKRRMQAEQSVTQFGSLNFAALLGSAAFDLRVVSGFPPNAGCASEIQATTHDK